MTLPMGESEFICSGWLTKSPSSKYVTLFTKGKTTIHIPLKSQWRRRFFILYKPKASLPHQYAFEYYKDEKVRKKCGSINLDDCSQIQSTLDSSLYKYIFSLKTTSQKSREKERVYYLATDSHEEVAKWVSCLCRLCGLRDASDPKVSETNGDDQVGPHPPRRLDSIQVPSSLMVDLQNDDLSEQIMREIEQDKLLENSLQASNGAASMRTSYQELANCTSGEQPAYENSVNILGPDRTSQLSTRSADTYDYDVPPKLSTQPTAHSNPVQKIPVPSIRRYTPTPKTDESLYENHQVVAASLSQSENRLSSTADSANFREEIYDVPSHKLTTVIPITTVTLPQPHDNFYENDVFSPEPKPPRPPKYSPETDHRAVPVVQASPRTPRLSTRSSESLNPDQLYDVPKPQPPPPCSGVTIHGYRNASSRILGSSSSVTTTDDKTSQPVRPPKPSKLIGSESSMDWSVIDSSGEHETVRVSHSNNTKTYMRDEVFSDSSPSSPVHEDIPLPQRIGGNDTSSDDGSECTDEIEAPPSTLLSQYGRHVTLDNLNRSSLTNLEPVVKRASSLSKVMNTHTHHTNQLSLSSMIPNPRSPKLNKLSVQPIRSIEYIELDTSAEKAAPVGISPKPAKKSHTFSPEAVREQVYTIIDEVKTKAIKQTKDEREFDLRSDSKSSAS